MIIDCECSCFISAAREHFIWVQLFKRWITLFTGWMTIKWMTVSTHWNPKHSLTFYWPQNNFHWPWITWNKITNKPNHFFFLHLLKLLLQIIDSLLFHVRSLYVFQGILNAWHLTSPTNHFFFVCFSQSSLTFHWLWQEPRFSLTFPWPWFFFFFLDCGNPTLWSVDKTKYAIHWIVIYPVKSVIHPSNK